MEILENGTLIKLYDVLNVKKFSFDVKQKLENILLIVMKLDIENKEKHIDSIIEGLKKIEIFEIDRRVNLIKNQYMEKHLKFSSGFYFENMKMVAVVKKSIFTNSTTYHELIHVTQKRYSYHVSSDYSFPMLFECAMREGEAKFYELMFFQKTRPRNYCSHEFGFYDVCLELYQNMRNIFGTELLEKWKNIDETQDMTIELDQYLKNKYCINFFDLYNLWIFILFYFCLDDNNYKKMIEIGDFEIWKVLCISYKETLEKLKGLMMNDKNYISLFQKLIIVIDEVLNNFDMLCIDEFCTKTIKRLKI